VCPTSQDELFGDDIQKCFLCGGPPTAYWFGSERVVAVCPACATDVLPRLLADAIVGPVCGHKTVVGRLRLAERVAKAAFWEAAASAIAAADLPLAPPRRCPYADAGPPDRNGRPHR
jgi:hypothetical protein